jgi:uncharacterized protein
MGYLSQFIIHYQSLPAGVHEFDFEISDKFFEHFEYSEVKKGNLEVRVFIGKGNAAPTLEFKAKGTVELACDRCTSDIELPVEGSYLYHIKESDITEDDFENETIMVIPKAALDLDLAPVIYENIALLLPYQRNNCTDSKGVKRCNMEVLKKLEDISIKEKSEESDPRWDALKKIKFTN